MDRHLPSDAHYDLYTQVSVCPFDVITGYTLFVEDEEKSVDTVVTRAELEAHIVVNLAGQCAEKLVLGQSEVTGERSCGVGPE
jgi:cell division protease FtsH